MFPQRYNIFVAEHSLVVMRNRKRIILIYLLCYFIMVTIFAITAFFAEQKQSDYFDIGVFVGVIYFFLIYKDLKRNFVVKIDNKTGLLQTGYKDELFSKSVLFIDISQAENSSGYMDSYLQLIVNNNTKVKDDSTEIFDWNNKEIKAMAKVLANFLGKEFKD